MVALTFSRIAAAITAIACVGSSLAAPALDARAKNTQIASKAPHFVIYSDSYVSGTTPDVSDVAGYNVL